MTLRCLTSYAYWRDTDMGELVGDLQALHGGRVEIFADSGAFSVATTGSTIKLADYAAWLHQWRHVITTAATLDVIGDPEATHRNTATLLNAGLNVLPAFHVGTPWPMLEDLCSRHAYLALGGMVPHSKRPDDVMRWLIRAFRIARHHGAVYHGFGQTRFATIAALPFYSVDSSAWVSGARYGNITLWDDRRCRLVTVPVGRPTEARKHAALLRTHGADPAVVGRPGFAHTAHRTAAEHAREYDMMRAAPMTAFHRLETWLARRHRVPPPAGWSDTGTCLFLACTDDEQMRLAARTLAPGAPCSAT
ncbi:MULTISPECIES: hypothetical protein [Streptomycetaceae]|uniref:Mycobacteriophage GP2 protein n=1 Tax=Streptantibioticus cattleyicolor (strain ATCC 35852 / DSM 46488 / JCM 4925 / NBRC 14057 / NRRL 8057) TaxID=1003195 RepID=F8JT17_STREN|nr:MULTISPECIES: hypothetical protein [Streptomycetaceae]AEW92952.1 mycobacteriophage GP2 protein [Streptantibioticus cattleyicolor NRRL 8057 = DSM 46488]MYS57699.1 hypothetical protein [Streptomyces sp. SID5468]CCB73313.1 putative Mycobacteriophage GP2 protein [Streptantibioticus cattleyicolor NRRL 8057 = DSM 46488]